MSGAYAKAAREALPHAKLIVDRFHLVKKANEMVDRVRRRVTEVYRGRRGHKSDPERINGRRLLRAAERLTDEQHHTLFERLRSAEPNGDIAAAWIAKELLRDVLACTARGGPSYEIRDALYRFYASCAACSVPEVGKLVQTISASQEPMILASGPGCPNACSEGYKRIVQHVGRTAFRFRTPANQRRRVRWACTRQSRRATYKPRFRPCLSRKSLVTSEEPEIQATAPHCAAEPALLRQPMVGFRNYSDSESLGATQYFGLPILDCSN